MHINITLKREKGEILVFQFFPLHNFHPFQVLSSVSPPAATAVERDEADPRPRDPRLLHSSKLKPATQPNV